MITSNHLLLFTWLEKASTIWCSITFSWTACSSPDPPSCPSWRYEWHFLASKPQERLLITMIFQRVALHLASSLCTCGAQSQRPGIAKEQCYLPGSPSLASTFWTTPFYVRIRSGAPSLSTQASCHPCLISFLSTWISHDLGEGIPRTSNSSGPGL